MVKTMKYTKPLKNRWYSKRIFGHIYMISHILYPIKGIIWV